MARSTTVICTTTFTALWIAGTPTRIISQTLKISADRCDTTRKQLGLARRESWHGSKTGHRKAYLPSESEIRQKCLEFQAGWTDEERERRRVGGVVKFVPYEAPVVPESLFRFSEDDESGPQTFLEGLIDTSG
jgi:hypothetical protein